MKIDPLSEASYRYKLSLEYLRRAERFLGTADYKESVEASQLSAENAAKVIVALRRVPSWSHDPSGELMEVARELPSECRGLAEELARLAHELAPERGTVTYGRPAEGLTPWELYDEARAREALRRAKRANEVVELMLKQMGYRIGQQP